MSFRRLPSTVFIAIGVKNVETHGVESGTKTQKSRRPKTRKTGSITGKTEMKYGKGQKRREGPRCKPLTGWQKTWKQQKEHTTETSRNPGRVLLYGKPYFMQESSSQKIVNYAAGEVAESTAITTMVMTTRWTFSGFVTGVTPKNTGGKDLRESKSSQTHLRTFRFKSMVCIYRFPIMGVNQNASQKLGGALEEK